MLGTRYRTDGDCGMVRARKRLEPRVWEERGLRDASCAGDEDAWRVLYDRCFAPLYTHVFLRTGGHVQRTEDVVQECWMIAVRRIRSFDPERGSFAAWMRGIADKVLQNKRRRWGRRDRTEVPAEREAVARSAPRIALAEEISVAMAGLPPAYQDVLRAKYAEGRTVKEIAAQRGQSPKAVESLLSRARTAFRDAFQLLEEG